MRGTGCFRWSLLGQQGHYFETLSWSRLYFVLSDFVRWLNQWPVGLKWYIFELNLNIIDIWNSGFLDRNFQIWWHPRAITTSTCHEKSLTGNKRWFEISFMEMPETVSRQPSKLRSPAASRVYFSYSWTTSSIYLVKSPRELLMEIFSKNKKLTKNKYG
jgi:hypothetical protein